MLLLARAAGALVLERTAARELLPGAEGAGLAVPAVAEAGGGFADAEALADAPTLPDAPLGELAAAGILLLPGGAAAAELL